MILHMFDNYSYDPIHVVVKLSIGQTLLVGKTLWIVGRGHLQEKSRELLVFTNTTVEDVD